MNEATMQNDQLPETQAIAQEMTKLGDGEPVFRNPDVVEQRDL